MSKTVFLTGASGLLGSRLAKEMLAEGHSLVLLARSGQVDVGKGIDSNRIKVICGDLSKINMGLNKVDERYIVDHVDMIYHSAALCDFGAPYSELFSVNVAGLKNILNIASICFKRGHLKSVEHISTIAVAGTTRGVWYEKDLNNGQAFNNDYERSKYEAEMSVETYRREGININIYRPSIITGDSLSGETNNFKMFYQPLHFFNLQLYKCIPARAETMYNFVPADYVAKAIYLISSQTDLKRNSTYHIVNDSYMSLGNFLEAASNYFGFIQPELVSLEEFNEVSSVAQNKLLEPYTPYLNYDLKYDSINSRHILSRLGFQWPITDVNFMNVLFEYCCKSGFIKSQKVTI